MTLRPHSAAAALPLVEPILPDPLNPADWQSAAHGAAPRTQRPPPLPTQPSAAGPPVQPTSPPPATAPWPPELQPPELQPGHDEDEQQWLVAVRIAPPWLISCIVHMAVLILLGLLMTRPSRDTLLTELTIGHADSSFSALLDPVNPADLVVEMPQPNTPPSQFVVEDPASAPLLQEIAKADVPSGLVVKAPAIGILLAGRDPGMRNTLLHAYGGSGATESAVQAGLGWLARQQHKSGSWSLVGPYADGARDENNAAASGMALLAFQGAGYTPTSGEDPKFREVVAKGWRSLLARQNADGSFHHFARNKSRTHNHGIYTHAIDALALCELYAMTRDPQYREPAQRAVNFLVKAQAKEGGWRYQPGRDSDLSVSGWVMMALQSARMAELNVPASTLYEFERFLDSVAHNGGREYAYQRNRASSLAMSAEGLLCRQYLGWEATDPRMVEGARRLAEHPINFQSNPDTYYWYYATQALHHLGGQPWEDWNKVMKVELPSRQVRHGKEQGSWNPMEDAWGGHAGRLYTTCLSIYMLEVYYRHLPIYSQPLNLRVSRP